MKRRKQRRKSKVGSGERQKGEDGREAVGGDVLTTPPPTSCLPGERSHVPWPAAIRGLRAVPCV